MCVKYDVKSYNEYLERFGNNEEMPLMPEEIYNFPNVEQLFID